MRIQLDMGSNISKIDEKTWKAIRKPYLDLTRKVAWNVCGNNLIFRGKITVYVSVKSKLAKAKIILPTYFKLTGQNCSICWTCQ